VVSGRRIGGIDTSFKEVIGFLDQLREVISGIVLVLLTYSFAAGCPGIAISNGHAALSSDSSLMLRGGAPLGDTTHVPAKQVSVQSTPRFRNGAWSTEYAAPSTPPNHWWLIDYWNAWNYYGSFVASGNTITGLASDDDVLILPLNLAYGESMNLEWFQFDIDFNGGSAGWQDNIWWGIWNVDAPSGCYVNIPPSNYHPHTIGLAYTIGHTYHYQGSIVSDMFRFQIWDDTAGTNWHMDFSVPSTQQVYDYSCFSPASAVEGYTTPSSVGNVPYYQFTIGYDMTSFSFGQYGSGLPAGLSINQGSLGGSPSTWHWEMLFAQQIRSWSLLNGLTPDASALAASSSELFLAARGMENGIWYRSMNTGGSWSSWSGLSGFTDARPAVAVFNSRLYLVCKEASTSNIWYGYYPLSGGVVSGAFSGWTMLDGPTPTALGLAADSSYLYLAAAASDGSIWHRRMDTSGTWSAWVMVPGFTDVSPAISVFQNRLYFACKEAGSNNVWYGYMDLTSYPNGWSGWIFLSGPTPDALTLTASSDRLYVVARGMENGIWYQSMDTSGSWTDWSQISGFTDVAPGIAIFNGEMYFVCKEAGTNNIWYI